MTGPSASSPTRSRAWATPLAGHKDNHSGLMTPKQMEAFRQTMGVREGHEWEPFEGLARDEAEIADFLKAVPFDAQGTRRFSAPHLAVPDELPVPKAEEISTQEGFGRILFDLAREDARLREPHRHDLAGRDCLNQSGRLGEPARRLRSRDGRRSLQDGEDRLHLSLDAVAQGPASGTGHCGEQSLHRAWRRWACRIRCSASGFFPSARSTIPSSRAASMRSIMPATRMRASSWWRRRRASRWRRKAARISPSARR